MHAKTIYLTIFCLFFTACASTNKKTADSVDSYPALTIQTPTPLNEARTLRKNDFLVKFEVKPENIAKTSSKERIDIVGSGRFFIDKSADFFPAKSNKYGVVYCGYTNLNRNATKTVLHQGCMGDADQNGKFETFFLRTGSNYKDISGFLYHDAEIEKVVVNGEFSPIDYKIHDASNKHTYQIAFRFNKISKNKGARYAVFDILAKKPAESEWTLFLSREPIKINIANAEMPTIFSTPMFTAEITGVNLQSIRAVITSVSPKSSFGFKRALKNSDSYGYKPAYQTYG